MSSESKNRPASASKPNHHTCPILPEQANRLRGLLLARGWEFEARPYMLFFARQGKVTVSVYEKGPKVVVQGKGMEEFVQFVLEPEVLGGVGIGGIAGAESGADASEEEAHPDWFTPHLGIDESGKGDFFGPLVIAGVYSDRTMAHQWRRAGIQDSKAIGSDARIRQLARVIRETPGAEVSVVLIGPQRYNELYQKFGNLNRLLAWGHARVIENLLEQKPDCPRALSDQFANPSLVRRALLERGRQIVLDQRTKAESDPAVAAASILAREAFVQWLQDQAKEFGAPLPKGASAGVKQVGRELVRQHGGEVLRRIAKVHFKTAAEILSHSQIEYLPRFGESY
ncbi:MAG: hypothetical protein RLZZ244_2339 [Verrucomicrobiota bacterium]|jgi:ribonuclease HIII